MEISEATLAQGDEGTAQVYDVASMPGFRFQPTEEELVGFYLRSMVMGNPRLEVELINVLDLYRYDPWELPAMAFMQGEREWLFFCPRDRKYPNGARPNRVTASGYWKATGTDRLVRRAHDARAIGLKKTLVFYTGKAPKGRKTEWIMNEYRLPQSEQHLRILKDPREVALCRIYKKPAPNPCTATLGFDVEGLGAESSTYTAECRDPGGIERDSILHNSSPCNSTSRSSPKSPSSPTLQSFNKRPTRDAIRVTERLNTQIHEHRNPTTSASSQQQHDASRIMPTTSVKVETGTLSSVVYPCPKNLESGDSLLAELMEAETRRPGRSFLTNSPQIRVAPPEVGTPGAHRWEPVDRVRDHAGCSSSNLNPTISTSLDRLLKATMWSSPLAMHDDLLPVSSSTFFSMNQFGWNYSAAARESPWLHSSSALPVRQSLLQIQGLQDHFQ